MGSFFGGVKAGTLSGAFYVGGLAVFNVILLYALKADVLNAIQQSYSQICTPAATLNSTSLEDCFSSVVAVDVPYVAFIGFFIALFYSGVFGLYYEGFPGGGSTPKGEVLAGVVGLNLVLLGFSGFYFDATATVSTVAFLVVWTLLFGYLLGRLYRKYTRVILFESQDPEALRILVGGRDFTGKERTFALSSTQKVRANVSEGSSFKEWEATGSISVEDNRSFETLVEVQGDGVLKALVVKKY